MFSKLPPMPYYDRDPNKQLDDFEHTVEVFAKYLDKLSDRLKKI